MSQGFTEAKAPNASVLPAVRSIFDMSAESLGQLRTWLEQNPPAIPVTQIIGFTQFTVNPATDVVTNETTTSGTFVDLATVGPTLSALSNGKYLFLFGATVTSSSAGTSVYMGISVNGATPGVPTQLISASANTLSVMRASVVTLTAGSNTVTAKYRTDLAVTGTFGGRYLLGLRISNA